MKENTMEFSPQEIEQLNNNSLYRIVGIRVEEVKDGEAKAFLQPKPAFCWPFEGQPHGGILFTLMDTTMGWAIQNVAEEGYTCATINLDIQYTKRARGDSFACCASITDQGNLIVYAKADIFDEDSRIIATGQGCFRIVKASPITDWEIGYNT
jgi:uncharacterized protein (TIGR00369 family)